MTALNAATGHYNPKIAGSRSVEAPRDKNEILIKLRSEGLIVQGACRSFPTDSLFLSEHAGSHWRLIGNYVK